MHPGHSKRHFTASNGGWSGGDLPPPQDIKPTTCWRKRSLQRNIFCPGVESNLRVKLYYKGLDNNMVKPPNGPSAPLVLIPAGNNVAQDSTGGFSGFGIMDPRR